MSATTTARVRGKCKFFNEKKGYGFIIRDDGSGDVFVHHSQLPEGVETLIEKQPVSFDIETSGKGLRAINVEID